MDSASSFKTALKTEFKNPILKSPTQQVFLALFFLGVSTAEFCQINIEWKNFKEELCNYCK